jgi:predicted nucleic acid-binding protein
VILVDSSVWIAYFNGEDTAEVQTLDRLLGSEPLSIGDLILTEVLQGFRSERDYKAASSLMTSLIVIEMCGRDIALDAAENYRILRGLGLTVRKTIDSIIATRCIRSGLTLLHNDRDFDPFARHLGLRTI